MSENWKEHFQGLSHIERLGLMRNPELSKQYLVALMEAPSGELNISRIEHAEILRAAAMNPCSYRQQPTVRGRKWWGR